MWRWPRGWRGRGRGRGRREKGGNHGGGWTEEGHVGNSLDGGGARRE